MLPGARRRSPLYISASGTAAAPQQGPAAQARRPDDGLPAQPARIGPMRTASCWFPGPTPAGPAPKLPSLPAGVSPLKASSGRITRHRFNPFGDRQLNWALRVIVNWRMLHHPAPASHLARRAGHKTSAKSADASNATQLAASIASWKRPPGLDNLWKRHDCDPNPPLGARGVPEDESERDLGRACRNQGRQCCPPIVRLTVNSRANSPGLSPRRPGRRSAQSRARPGRPERSESPRSGVRGLPGWRPRRRSPRRA